MKSLAYENLVSGHRVQTSLVVALGLKLLFTLNDRFVQLILIFAAWLVDMSVAFPHQVSSKTEERYLPIHP